MCWTLKIVTFPGAYRERVPFPSPCLKPVDFLSSQSDLVSGGLGPLQVLALRLTRTLVSSDVPTFQVRVLTSFAGLGWLCPPGKL